MRLTVLTPTLNPRPEYLQRVVDALRAQTLPVNKWEFLLVDNGSDPPLEGRIDLAWHPHARILAEPITGLTPARLRGFSEARSDLIVMVDDDCVLSPDYLETAVTLMEEYPHIGALGAYIEGEFHGPVETWMEPFLIYLCAMQFSPGRKVDMQYAMSRHPGRSLPAGAGMVVRRMVYNAYSAALANDERRSKLDRTGEELVGGGDLDLAYTSIDLGMAVGNTMRLQLMHLIPAERLQFEYLRRLLYASSFGSARLNLLRGWAAAGTDARRPLFERVGSFVRRYRKGRLIEECRIAHRKGYEDGLIGRFDPRFRSPAALRSSSASSLS